jgi:hypothetical protein
MDPDRICNLVLAVLGIRTFFHDTEILTESSSGSGSDPFTGKIQYAKPDRKYLFFKHFQ